MKERLSAKTILIGLMAYPIRHSLSPTMHNEAFAKLGLDYAYLAFEVGEDELEDAVKSIRALDMKGSNVSMPNKQNIIKYLDRLSPAAELMGAVNTVVNEGGILTGHNTDGIGCMKALKENGVDIKDKKITICGAGGAATAIAIQAALDGLREISVFNRNDEFFEKAISLTDKINKSTDCKAKLFKLEDNNDLKDEISSSDIFINATGVGMKPLEGKCLISDKSMLREDLIVFDVVYMPKETELLKIAKESGCKAINGLGMMLYQGAAAFEMWTGEEMPVEYIKEIMF